MSDDIQPPDDRDDSLDGARQPESDETDERRWSLRTWGVGFGLAVAFFAVLITVAALVLAAPSWNASNQAHQCLVDARDDYVSMIDQVSADKQEEYKGDWNRLADSADNPDNFFDPIGDDPLYTGDLFCSLVDRLVEDLKEEAGA